MKNYFRIIFSVIGIILLVWFIHSIQIDAETLLAADWQLMIAAVAFFLGIIPLAARRTRAMLHALSIHESPPLLGVELGARFLYYVTPFRLNIPGKALLLSKTTGISRTTGLSLTILEFTIDSLFTLGIALTGVFFLSGLTVAGGELLFPITTVLIIIGLAYLFSPSTLWKKLSQKNYTTNTKFNRLLQRIFSIAEQFHSNTQKMAGSSWRIEIIFLTSAIWVLSTASLALTFEAYKTHIPIEILFVITAIGLIVGMLSQVPGGIGFKETSMVLLLSNLGIPISISGLAVLWVRAFTIIPILLGYWFILSQKENPFSLTESPAQNSDKKLS